MTKLSAGLLMKDIQQRDTALAKMYQDCETLKKDAIKKQPADNTNIKDFQHGALFRIEVSRELLIHLVKTGFLRPDQVAEGKDKHDKKVVLKWLRTLPEFIQ
mgnify:CR=1 FL=1